VQKGIPLPNDYDTLLRKAYNDRDFVWNKRKGVRVMGPMEAGGHPALAGMDDVHCAGRIERSGFFFHSGHYKPKREAVLQFIANQIETTCGGMPPGAHRDAKVNQIATREFRLYRNHSSDVYATSLQQEFDEVRGVRAPAAAAALAIHPWLVAAPASPARSAPIAIGQPRPAAAAAAAAAAPPPPPPPPPSLTSSIGITTIGIAFATTRLANDRARWVPDGDVTKCQNCPKKFGVMTRKHHCRKCGNIFCSSCSSHTLAVRYPAMETSPKTSGVNTAQVRVCDPCFHRGAL